MHGTTLTSGSAVTHGSTIKNFTVGCSNWQRSGVANAVARESGPRVRIPLPSPLTEKEIMKKGTKRYEFRMSTDDILSEWVVLSEEDEPLSISRNWCIGFDRGRSQKTHMLIDPIWAPPSRVSMMMSMERDALIAAKMWLKDKLDDGSIQGPGPGHGPTIRLENLLKFIEKEIKRD